MNDNEIKLRAEEERSRIVGLLTDVGVSEKRMKLMETRNPLRWVLMFRDWKYYNSKKNCLSDLYLVLFGSFRKKAI